MEETQMQPSIRWGRAIALAYALSLGTLTLGTGAAHADALDDIMATKKIRIATDLAIPPSGMIDDQMKPVGSDVETAQLLAKDWGLELEFVQTTGATRIPNVQTGKADIIISTLSVTPERARKYGYTHAIGSADNVVVARADDNRIRTLEDLNGLVVATQLASAVQPELEEHNRRLESQGRGGYRELRLFTAFPESQLALAAGQVDAIVVASPAAAVLLRKVPGKYRIAARFGHTTPLAWVTRPEDVDLRNYIDLRIDELRDSGRLRELQLKWLGFEMDAVGDRRSPVV